MRLYGLAVTKLKRKPAGNTREIASGRGQKLGKTIPALYIRWSISQHVRIGEKMIAKIGSLSDKQKTELLKILKARFEKNTPRHKGISWDKVETRLASKPDKLWSLNEMERTGGEPDVVSIDSKTGEVIYFDCSAESPKERRSLCYDQEALDERKEAKPAGSAKKMANAMGVELLTEAQYRELQTLGKFDLKTSSWVDTPDSIRKLGGALFCDRRYEHVFLYHNGAQSYYAVRGFRGCLRI